MKYSHSAHGGHTGRGNHSPMPAMELRAGIEPETFRLRNGYSARLSYRSACQPPKNVEVSRHPAAVWPDVFSHGTDERQPLWAVPDALSQHGSVGSSRNGDWSRSTDSNREPAAYKTAALPLRYCGTFPPAAVSRQDGPCRVHRWRKVAAISGVFCSKLPIQKRTECRWPWVTQPRTARRAFAPFQNAIPAALKGDHFFALRVVPCRPGRLRGTCRRVQLRAQWTVGERFGRFDIPVYAQCSHFHLVRTSASAPTSLPAGRSPVPQT